MILIILLAFSLPYMYGGCVVVYSSDGFDRNQDQKDDESSQGYAGLTTQAAITQMNAEALAAGEEGYRRAESHMPERRDQCRAFDRAGGGR